MYSFVAFFAIIASVAAFVPSGKVASSKMSMAFAGGLPGNEGPELKNFDPLKFSEKSPEWAPYYREAELKHGRIAMLATAGWIAVDLGIKLGNVPGAATSLEAHNAAVSSGAMIQILGWSVIIKLIYHHSTHKFYYIYYHIY